ncbi:MAG: ABC transporter permease [Egibacteraceae bacterium]
MAQDTATSRVEEREPEVVIDPAPGGRTGLSRLEIIGGLYLVVGLALAWLGSQLPSDAVSLQFGVGAIAPGLDLDPAVAVPVLAGLIAASGVAGLLDRRLPQAAVPALVGGTVLVVPLVLIATLSQSGTPQTNVITLLGESLRLATPIALGALAGLFCERSGIINIGIEGMMLAGAGIGFVFYGLVGQAAGGWPLYAAVVVAVATGGMMAALHAVMTITFRVDQIVSGVAINLLAIGITSFLRRQVIIPEGLGGGVTLPSIDLPGLSSLPVLGRLFVGQPVFLSMFVIFVLVQVVLFRSAWGLRVRSVGENAHASETLGINVVKTRYQAVIIGGLLAGLAGAWFSLETVGTFDDVMTNGTGFIALAALIFGKWRPWPAFGGAVLFGFSEAFGARLQLLGAEVAGYPIPAQFLQSLPFVVTIIVLAGAIGRAVPPADVGKPYERSR